VVTDPIQWAEQLACYPFMAGEARWATESLIGYARALRQELVVVRSLCKQLRKKLMQEQVTRLALANPMTGEFSRSGNLDCKACGFEYADHPPDPDHPWLKVLCDLTRVKL